MCQYQLRTFGFFFIDINLFNEVLHKSKALKRQIGAIISNTISTTPILEIDYFTGSKGTWIWQSNIVNDEGLCVDSWLRKSGVIWALLCHTNTMLKEFKVYKTSKFLLQYCHAIYMLTRLRQQVFQEFFFHVQSGSERVRTRSGTGFHTSPGCRIPGKVTQIFNPSASHQGN